MLYDIHMDVLSLLAEHGTIKPEDVENIEKEARENGATTLAVLEKRGISQRNGAPG